MVDGQIKAVDLGLQLRRNGAQRAKVAFVEVLLLRRDKDPVEPDQRSNRKGRDRQGRSDGAKSKSMYVRRAPPVSAALTVGERRRAIVSPR
jgi:hypothetical protein